VKKPIRSAPRAPDPWDDDAPLERNTRAARAARAAAAAAPPAEPTPAQNWPRSASAAPP
jgi:hypothetical protein